jgi:AhpD family alkylhydroperoxidase
MSEHYHDAGDLRFLKEMGKLAPTEFKAWLALNNIVGRDEGAIPRKYRELIALGVAFTTQCPYCIEAHAKAAKAAGASREEITESSLIAAALRAGGAATHGAMALKFYEQSHAEAAIRRYHRRRSRHRETGARAGRVRRYFLRAVLPP